MRRILLIMIGVSLFLNADFIRDTDGIVSDDKTGLEWQDDYDEDPSTHDEYQAATWHNAIEYCENLTLGQKSDWRLPNLNELYSIIEKNRDEPAIDRSVFKNSFRAFTNWSSTTKSSDSSRGWIVSFYHGTIYSMKKTSNELVRCVRDTD